MDTGPRSSRRALRRRYWIALLVGVAIGALFVAPAGAHLIDDMDHLWFDHLVSRAQHLPTVPFATSVETVTPLSRGSSTLAMTIGTDGLPVISFFDPGPGDLRVAHCRVAACSLNDVFTVDSAGVVGQYSSIAIGTDGRPIISYYDATNHRLKAAHCGDPACSSGNTTTPVAARRVGSTGQFTSIGIGRDNPWIAFYDNTAKDLRIARCQNTTCSQRALVTLDSLRDVGKYASLAIDYGGFPLVSYYDASATNLKFAKCTAIDCSSNSFVTVDIGTDVGRYTSLAIGSDGLPVIAYYDAANQDLKLATCGDAICKTANTLTVVDPTGNAGAYASVAIGDDGFPVISYRADGHLKAAKCRAQKCPPSKLLTVLDQRSGSGAGTAVANAPDGKPVVAEVYSTGSELAAAKCANPFCLRRWWRRG
jgi:hypothetical protein